MFVLLVRMKVAIGLPVIRSDLRRFVVVIGVKRELSDIREHRSAHAKTAACIS
jgi:hypothetical protein